MRIEDNEVRIEDDATDSSQHLIEQGVGIIAAGTIRAARIHGHKEAELLLRTVFETLYPLLLDVRNNAQKENA